MVYIKVDTTLSERNRCTLSATNISLTIITHFNTCFGDYSYSVGTQHGNRHQPSVTTSRVTYFILHGDTGTFVSHRQHKKNS